VTDDLTTRLLEAIGRREKAASEAQPGPWHIGNAVDPTKPCNIHTHPGARGVADNLGGRADDRLGRRQPRRTDGPA
jgi:hypothetical protein